MTPKEESVSPKSMQQLKNDLVQHTGAHQNLEYVTLHITEQNWKVISNLLGVSASAMPQFLGKLSAAGAIVGSGGNETRVSDDVFRKLVPTLIML